MMDGVDSDQDTQPETLELTINGKPHRAMLRPGEVLLVGRDPTCQIVVPDRSVSRRHAEIRRVGDAWVIRDLGSRNGIHRDGERAETITVTNGTQIRIGSPHDGPLLTFALPGARSPAPPTQRSVPAPSTQHSVPAPPTQHSVPASSSPHSVPAQRPQTEPPVMSPLEPPLPGPPPPPATPRRARTPGGQPGRPEIAAFD